MWRRPYNDEGEADGLLEITALCCWRDERSARLGIELIEIVSWQEEEGGFWEEAASVGFAPSPWAHLRQPGGGGENSRAGELLRKLLFTPRERSNLAVPLRILGLLDTVSNSPK